MKKGYCKRFSSSILPYLLLAILVLVGDAWVKAWVHSHIPMMRPTASYPYGGIPVFYHCWGIDFSIVHVMNRGAAWGIFSNFQDYLLYLRVGVIGALLIYWVRSPRDYWHRCCLALIISGAVGNVLDYFLYGHVVDMFYFVFWGFSYPVFNVADSAIFCGILGLIIRSFRTAVYD